MNMKGYLPADLYPLMQAWSIVPVPRAHVLQFYGAMGLCYLVIGLAWIVAMYLYMNDLMRLQFWIGGVAFICLWTVRIHPPVHLISARHARAGCGVWQLRVRQQPRRTINAAPDMRAFMRAAPVDYVCRC